MTNLIPMLVIIGVLSVAYLLLMWWIGEDGPAQRRRNRKRTGLRSLGDDE